MNTNLSAQLARLDPPARALLDRAATVALAHDADPYLVGGGVRDLLLRRGTGDLDVVVVGDAVAVARALHDALGDDGRAALRVHEPFGTATILPADGPGLDLITARREAYPTPGALPVVTPGTIDDDLRRRDFTINALAVALAPDRFGALLDPLGGRGDLAAGVVRLLHNASFADDPTRLLRAARYAGRLGFTLAPATAARFRDAITDRTLGTVSIDRLSHEFARLLAEDRAAAGFDLLAAHDALPQIAPGLRWDDAARSAFARLHALWPPARRPRDRDFARWEARFALLAAHLPPDAARAAATGLRLTAGASELAGQVARGLVLVGSTALPARASALGRLLDPFDPTALVAIAALLPDEARRERIVAYLTTIRPLAPTLTGDALIALGVQPGPIFRDALAALRDHKRDHPTVTTEEERAFLEEWLAARGWPRGGS